MDAEFFAIVTDLAGAPLELIDPESRAVAGSQSPTIWGRGSWRGVSSPLAFAGQQVDTETGLHYNRFRYYDPATASYTSPDPLGIAPNPSAANAYVHNPHTWIDPLGLACPPPKNGDESVPVNMKYKEDWTPTQRSAADEKVAQLNRSDTRVTRPERASESASRRFRSEGNDVPKGVDVDHSHDLQLGGADHVSKITPLDRSVNRSLGSQIHHQIKHLPNETPVGPFSIS